MSELTLTLLRLGYLALLWLLVLAVTAVLRRDLFGTKVTRRATPGAAARTLPGRPHLPARAGRAGRGQAPPGPDGRRGPRTIVVTDGSLKGTTIALGQAAILVGRAPECTLVLEDDYASNRHARFFLDDAGTWLVEDLGSTNGTFLGRTKVESPTPVEPGVPVRVGRTVLELRR